MIKFNVNKYVNRSGSYITLVQAFGNIDLCVEVNVSDLRFTFSCSTLTEALRFRQEGHPELKCYSPLKI